MGRILRSFLLLPFLAAVPGLLPAATGAGELEIEKLKLEIERLKLENQRLQLEIETLKARAQRGGGEEKDGKPEKAEKRFAGEVAEKAGILAGAVAGDPGKLVLDFTNAEFWHGGVRGKMQDLPERAKREKWPMERTVVNRKANGTPRYRYQVRNVALMRYRGSKEGIFLWEAPEGEGFSFVTPEGMTPDSTPAEVRNAFETPYYTFDEEKETDGLRVLRFKHNRFFLKFDDVLQFYFDDSGRLVRVAWGWLDQH